MVIPSVLATVTVTVTMKVEPMACLPRTETVFGMLSVPVMLTAGEKFLTEKASQTPEARMTMSKKAKSQTVPDQSPLTASPIP